MQSPSRSVSGIERSPSLGWAERFVRRKSTLPCANDTALIRAVREGQLDVVKSLVAKEAGLRNSNGETALMVAAITNQPEMCRLLVPHERSIRSTKQRDAFILAAKHGNYEALEAMTRDFQLRRDIHSLSALDYAVLSGGMNLVTLILNTQRTHQSDLSHAIIVGERHGRKDLVNLLRQRPPSTKDYPCKCCEQYYMIMERWMNSQSQGVQTERTDVGNGLPNVVQEDWEVERGKLHAEIKMLHEKLVNMKLFRCADLALLEKNEEIERLKGEIRELTAHNSGSPVANSHLKKLERENSALRIQIETLKSTIDKNAQEIRQSRLEGSSGIGASVRASPAISPAGILLQPLSPGIIEKEIQVDDSTEQRYKTEISALKARLASAEEAIKRTRANYESLYKLSTTRQATLKSLKAENDELKRRHQQMKQALAHVAANPNRQSFDTSPTCLDEDVDRSTLSRLGTSTSSSLPNILMTPPRAVRQPQLPGGPPLNLGLDDVTVKRSTTIGRIGSPRGAQDSARYSTRMVMTPLSVATDTGTMSKRCTVSQPNRPMSLISPESEHPEQALALRTLALSSRSSDCSGQEFPLSYAQSIVHPSLADRSSMSLEPLSRQLSLGPTSLHLASPRQTLNYGSKLPLVPAEAEHLTPLMQAVVEDSIDRLHENMSYARRQTPLGMTALMFAAEYNRHALARELVQAEGGMRTKDGRTALYIAIKNGHYRIAELLRQREGIQVSHKSRVGNRRTELMQAVISGDIVAVWCLTSIQSGLVDENGMTALMHAVVSLNVPAITILYPVEYRFKDKEGRTAKDYIDLIPETASEAQRELVRTTLERNKL
ncbi:Ankyrin repeat protein 1 [Giardia muris]|uniref:Ankyrin repeat protein 1 n=1 Tax=Giardia muris TaxID=5742 RepID=A0A4Z1SVN5_GIAMU|nr:Ankyrin repeat protein 1 [Giardia muris]|eukprot:TNJ27648.1 Ankyrin repeat protein 1 [Giardia muris]